MKNIISNSIRVILVLALIVSIISKNWVNTFTVVLTIALTFLPVLLTHQWKISLPESVQLTMVVFVFLSNYLGEVHDFYFRFWWWDTMLHGISGIVLGMIGLMLVDSLNKYGIKNVTFALSPFFVAFFAFTFTLAAGAIWELFEYACDSLLGMNMQKWMIDPQEAMERGMGVTWQGPGLTDTMKDIMMDTLGGVIISTIGYINLKYREKSIVATDKESTEQ